MNNPQKKKGLIVLMIFRRNTPILSFIIIQCVTVSGPAGLFCLHICDLAESEFIRSLV
jgi:hypothetical protein